MATMISGTPRGAVYSFIYFMYVWRLAPKRYQYIFGAPRGAINIRFIGVYIVFVRQRLGGEGRGVDLGRSGDASRSDQKLVFQTKPKPSPLRGPWPECVPLISRAK